MYTVTAYQLKQFEPPSHHPSFYEPLPREKIFSAYSKIFLEQLEAYIRMNVLEVPSPSIGRIDRNDFALRYFHSFSYPEIQSILETPGISLPLYMKARTRLEDLIERGHHKLYAHTDRKYA